MTERDTYEFLKDSLTKTLIRKNIPKSINWKYLQQINMKWERGKLIISDDSEYIVSDAGKDFIDAYDLKRRPIKAAEKANYISIAALIVAIIALVKSFGIL